jgi:hypothetical protein
MSPISITIITGACAFTGALFGIWLQDKLPKHHQDSASHEIVKLGSGMLATITALVLGLLVSSAKGTFDTLGEGIRQMSGKIILLDRTLAQYGPDAQSVRDQLKRSMIATLQATSKRPQMSDEEIQANRSTNRIEAVQFQLRTLTPKTDAQRELLTGANQIAGDLAQTRWLLMEESQSELPVPLLTILIVWLMVLFISFGLYSPRNGTVIAVLFVCAGSMSAAIFLVLELNRPLEGFIRVSPAPLINVMQHLGK